MATSAASLAWFARADVLRGGRRRSSRPRRVAVPAPRASAVEPPPSDDALLVIVECDGVMTDVHLDGHREAFNETFRDLGMEGASWSQDEYLSLLRSGGGTAHGMVERYFHFYGYPTKELRADDMLADASASFAAGAVPEGYEDASPEVIVAAARAAASRDPLNKEVLRERRLEWIDDVVRMKDERFRAMVREGRLKLRKGAAQFIDECLLEDAKVVLVGATASDPEEGVLPAVLEALGPLRAAAVSVSGEGGAARGADASPSSSSTSPSSPSSSSSHSSEKRHVSDADLDGFGEHVGAHDEAWEEARRQMQHAMKARKGELLADEVGGDLQRQSFDSNFVIDTGVFRTSTRSVVTAGALRSMLRERNVSPDRAVFVGASRTTCTEANAAGVFNVVCRTANQADSQIVGVACVVDDFGSGGGLTVRYVKARMASWKGETVGGREI